jgi:hypothetical protein
MVSCRSARETGVTVRDLIAYCRLAIFAPYPKVKAVYGALRCGLARNEGEAECFRVVETARQYDLDRV